MKGFDLLGILKRIGVVVPDNFMSDLPGLPVVLSRAQLEYVIAAAILATVSPSSVGPPEKQEA